MTQGSGPFDEIVLIVDDDADVREYLTVVISALNVPVVAAASGAEGLEVLKSREAFLILSDFNMPGMDGLQFGQEVRSTKPSVPLIMITGYADKSIAIQALKLAYTDFLEKPVSKEVLRELVLKYYEQRKQELATDALEIEQLTQTLVEEAAQAFDGLDQLILRLEADELDWHVLDQLFRKVHTIKGSAGAVPAGRLLHELCHDFESALDKIRKLHKRPDESFISTLLNSHELALRLTAELRNPQGLSSEMALCVQSMVKKLVDSSSAYSQSGSAMEGSAHVDAVHEKFPGSREESHEEDGVWVSSQKLDSFMKLSGELIVLKNQMQSLARSPDLKSIPAGLSTRIRDTTQTYMKLTDRLQAEIMAVRKVSLSRALSKLPRVIRKTAQDLGKRVKYAHSGLELGVDKTIAKALSEAMVHIVRNSIDHGIELPLTRRGLGKKDEGLLEVQVTESHGMIQIVVRDDGAGINRDRVVLKAKENGLISATEAETLSDEAAYALIFLPGFSTAETVTAVSGRGVGMDAVKAAIESVHGTIRVLSKPGSLTLVQINIPVPKTVLIENTLLVKTSGVFLAIPENSIAAVMKRSDIQQNSLMGSSSCQFNQQTIPLARYQDFVQAPCHDDKNDFHFALMLRDKTSLIALKVDALFGRLEAVVRPFDSLLSQLPGLKGTTVLGNGEIAYVVSIADLIQEAARRQRVPEEVRYEQAVA